MLIIRTDFLLLFISSLNLFKDFIFFCVIMWFSGIFIFNSNLVKIFDFYFKKRHKKVTVFKLIINKYLEIKVNINLD